MNREVRVRGRTSDTRRPWCPGYNEMRAIPRVLRRARIIDWYSAERTIYRDESRNTCVSAASSGMSIIDTLTKTDPPTPLSPDCLLLRKPKEIHEVVPWFLFLFPFTFTINRYPRPGLLAFSRTCTNFPISLQPRTNRFEHLRSFTISNPKRVLFPFPVGYFDFLPVIP